MSKRLLTLPVLVILILFVPTACNLIDDSGSADSGTYRVTRVIDGDTIDVEMNGEVVRVRYVGVNTPERDEPCYQDATQANRDLVEGKFVRLERDTSDTDRYDRLLRYIYVDDVMVNEQLVQGGWAEVVRYPPDDAYFNRFRDLERQATSAGLGCHPTGIFADNNFDR